ncbi:MAG: replicative DNA helicase [Firmicutes bacterium]|nr:replicative DNA helicase [Bacillota bacterium]
MERIPPQSLEAEQSVLGSMLIEKQAILRAMETLRAEDFYYESHQVIYRVLTKLFDRNQAIDLITVTEALRQEGTLDKVGGVAALTSLANIVPTAANIEYYARIVEEKAILRDLIRAATDVVAKSYAAKEDVEVLLDEAEQRIFSVSQRRSVQGYVPLKDVLVETLERIEFLYANKGGALGVPTGFKDLDNLTSGFQPSDLVILAARPSVGKTTLALNILRNAAIKDKTPCAIFSLEMAREQLAQRLLCAEAGIDGKNLRTGFLNDTDWTRLSGALGRLGEAPIFIDDTPNISIMELRTKARRIKSEHGLGLLVIDYLQLMQARYRVENRQQEISEISRSLKALARELKVPVVALSQLSRAVEQRQDRRPMLSDLRESGAIEQDADVVMFLYSNPDMESSNVIELILAKQRNGPTGSLKLYFLKDLGKFQAVEERYSA